MGECGGVRCEVRRMTNSTMNEGAPPVDYCSSAMLQVPYNTVTLPALNSPWYE